MTQIEIFYCFFYSFFFSLVLLSSLAPAQPVYLFIHIKPGKGNLGKKLSVESTRSFGLSLSESPRTRTLSINGEPVKLVSLNSTKVDLSEVNIHDYAIFEKEKDLLPEFRESIKNKKLEERELKENNNNAQNDSPKTRQKANVRRNTSFQEVARKVRQIEKVLIKWPRRSRQRHHSSSSEDFVSDSETDGASSDALGRSSSVQRKKKHKKPLHETNNNEGAVKCALSLKTSSSKDEANCANLDSVKMDMLESDAVGTDQEKTKGLRDNMNVVLLGGEQSCDVHAGGSPLPLPPSSHPTSVSDGLSKPEDQTSISQKSASAAGASSDKAATRSSSSGCCRCVVL